MTPAVLRPGRPDDPDALAMTAEVQRWYVEIYGGEDDEPVDADAFAPPCGRFLIAREGGDAVGMGGYTLLPDGDAKLRRMYVREAARRRGTAALLLAELEALAAADGARRCVLTTGVPQAAAVAFYRAAGYEDGPPSGFHAGSPTAVHLVKRLRAG